MMSEEKQKDFIDDGHTIADMSGVERRRLFGARPTRPETPPQSSSPAERQEQRETAVTLTREERLWAVLGMLKAVLLVGLCFAVGLALVILAFLYL